MTTAHIHTDHTNTIRIHTPTGHSYDIDLTDLETRAATNAEMLVLDAKPTGPPPTIDIGTIIIRSTPGPYIDLHTTDNQHLTIDLPHINNRLHRLHTEPAHYTGPPDDDIILFAEWTPEDR
jgi:hypothetical protein